MLGYFSKKLEDEVLGALLEPFWLWMRAWTKDLSWQGRTLLLVLAGLVALAAVYWKLAASILSNRRGLWEDCHERSYANSSGSFVNRPGSRNIATPR